MKKLQSRRKILTPRRTVLLLSFLIPIVIMLLAWGILQFWPVGERSPLTIDLYHQYVSFLSEMRRKIMNFESLFYSWRIGLGTNFFALLAYYAASPLNLLLPLFPMQHITEAVAFLTVTKLGFAAWSFAYMLMNSIGKEGLFSIRSKERVEEVGSEDFGGDAMIVAVSVAYALCGFNLAFSWDVMWLDVTAALPLVILGVHKLIREGKTALYALSLAFCLFVNYYIAFFVCIFTALYFFVAYFSAQAAEDQYKEDLRQGRRLSELSYEERFLVKENRISFWPIALRFGIVTLIGVAISSFLLFPTFLSLADTSAAGDSFPSAWSFRFSAFDFLTHQLMAIPPSIRRGLPNIYSGILVFTFVPLYIFSTRIRIKEKLPHLILLAFLFISFNSNYLDFIWHGMHYPNQLPYRYSFLFSFLLLIIVFRTLTVIREFSSKSLALTTGLGVLFVIMAERFNDDLITHGNAYINIFFFMVYLLLFMLIWKRNYFRTVLLLLAVVMVGEVTINGILTVAQIAENEVYTSRTHFIAGMEEIEELLQVVQTEEDGDFYRMEVLPAKTTNDGALYGYPGFTLFSSTSREPTAKFFRKFAYHGNNINSYKHVASTAVGDSLLGLEYFILKNSTTTSNRDTLLEEVARSGEMTLMRNPYALEVGAAANPEFASWNSQTGNPFRNWNNMLRTMAGIDPVFEPIEMLVTEGSNFQPSTGNSETGKRFVPEDQNSSTLMRMEIPIEEAQHLYLAFNVTQSTNVQMSVKRGDDLIVDENNSGEPYDLEETTETSPATVSSETTEEMAESSVPLSVNRNVHFFETFDAGHVLPGDIVEVSFEQASDKASDVTVYAAGMKLDAYRSAMESLQERAIDVTEWSANGFLAHYTAPEAGILYLSIPYDSSWNAKIDGQEVEISHIGDEALLAIPTDAGAHTLELNFVPRGFYIGLILTIVGSILLVLFVIDEKKFRANRINKRREKRYQKLSKSWAQKDAQAIELEESLSKSEENWRRDFSNYPRRPGQARVYHVSKSAVEDRSEVQDISKVEIEQDKEENERN